MTTQEKHNGNKILMSYMGYRVTSDSTGLFTIFIDSDGRHLPLEGCMEFLNAESVVKFDQSYELMMQVLRKIRSEKISTHKKVQFDLSNQERILLNTVTTELFECNKEGFFLALVDFVKHQMENGKN